MHVTTSDRRVSVTYANRVYIYFLKGTPHKVYIENLKIKSEVKAYIQDKTAVNYHFKKPAVATTKPAFAPPRLYVVFLSALQHREPRHFSEYYYALQKEQQEQAVQRNIDSSHPPPPFGG